MNVSGRRSAWVVCMSCGCACEGGVELICIRTRFLSGWVHCVGGGGGALHIVGDGWYNVDGGDDVCVICIRGFQHKQQYATPATTTPAKTPP